MILRTVELAVLKMTLDHTKVSTDEAEEKFMSEQLRKEYLIYRERTKKIIPFLY